ncbi:MAG TPA: TetR/AcrR family transcriptional regulator [Pseudonocardiaceae bacterium]|jgi:AcrR family transcriptional regulator
MDGATRQQRGRPRNAETDRVILAATGELLLTNGYGRLSMEAVAARSGIGKPTLYRRWSSKAALVADAVLAGLSVEAAPLAVTTPVDSGDIAQDLREWLDAYITVATDPHNAALIQALMAAAAENPDDLFGLLTDPRHEALTARLRGASRAGQIRADADLDAIADTLLGTLLLPLLTGRTGTARQRAHGLLEVILRGLGPTDAQAADGSRR